MATPQVSFEWLPAILLGLAFGILALGHLRSRAKQPKENARDDGAEGEHQQD